MEYSNDDMVMKALDLNQRANELQCQKVKGTISKEDTKRLKDIENQLRQILQNAR